MANPVLNHIMQDLQKHIKHAKFSLDNLSTIAKNGDEKLVEKFISETVFVQPAAGQRQLSDNTQAVLQSQLYVACFWGVKNIVRDLIELAEAQEIDINISAKNPNTLWTPLHAATFQEHGPLIMYLLSNGANPNSKDSEGRSPVDFASASDKTWGHFAALGCPRTSKSPLITMGIIKKNDGSPKPSPRVAGKGLKMAEYSHPNADDPMTNDAAMSAAMGGDVLANDDQQDTRKAQQPQFAIYK